MIIKYFDYHILMKLYVLNEKSLSEYLLLKKFTYPLDWLISILVLILNQKIKIPNFRRAWI